MKESYAYCLFLRYVFLAIQLISILVLCNSEFACVHLLLDAVGKKRQENVTVSLLLHSGYFLIFISFGIVFASWM
jgi:hypothetical protein